MDRAGKGTYDRDPSSLVVDNVVSTSVLGSSPGAPVDTPSIPYLEIAAEREEASGSNRNDPNICLDRLTRRLCGFPQSTLRGLLGFSCRAGGRLILDARCSPGRPRPICREVSLVDGDRRICRDRIALSARGRTVSLVPDSRRTAAGFAREDRQVVRPLDRD